MDLFYVESVQISLLKQVAAKKAEEAAKQNWSGKEAEEETMKLEIVSLQKSVEAAEVQLGATDEAIQGFVDEANKLSEQLQVAKQSAAEANAAVKSQKETLASNRSEISSLQNKWEKTAKAKQNQILEAEELTHSISRAKESAGNAKQTVERMLEEYEWIAEERKFFGQPNTNFDFKATDPKKAGHRIEKLEETKVQGSLFILLY